MHIHLHAPGQPVCGISLRRTRCGAQQHPGWRLMCVCVCVCV